jgi:hypothetical protein
MFFELDKVLYFLTIPRPDFDLGGNSTGSEEKASSFRYLMLVYPTSTIYSSESPDSNASLGLVVLVSSAENFRLQHLQIRPAQDAGIPLKEYLDVRYSSTNFQDGFYLGDIVRYATNRMKILIEQVFS